MKIRLKCLGCGKTYICFPESTKIYTSIIVTSCPHCGHVEERNISKFLDLQTDEYKERYPKINAMITLAHQLGREVNDDGVPKKKLRKKK